MNLSQRQVAERGGVHPTHISLVETGKLSPTHKTLLQVAEGLGVPCSWILTLEEIYARREDG